jgi:[ribosomal protein S5]-alanine N-acetyltransferase
MPPPEIFMTTRLTLRPPRAADAAAIFASYAQDPAVTHYLTWTPHTTVEETRRFVQRCVEGWQTGREYTWLLCLPDVAVIGCIALRVDGGKADVGYGLAQACWGRGYATEALHALAAWSLQQPEIFRLWAVCDIENLASARVMEKVGMQREGILRKWIRHPNRDTVPRDCLCYALVKP